MKGFGCLSCPALWRHPIVTGLHRTKGYRFRTPSILFNLNDENANRAPYLIGIVRQLFVALQSLACRATEAQTLVAGCISWCRATKQ